MKLWWKRWVDNIFARITKRDYERLPNIVDFLNSQHESIQFTVETETSGALPFMEVKVSATSRRNGNYETSVYRKPTHTNQYVQWNSAHPPSQKIGIFRTLLTRAKRIFSPANYNSEKSNLVEIFVQNGYPRNQLAKEICKFENTQQQPNPKESEDSVILSVPYVPGFSDKLSKQWKRTAAHFEIPIKTNVVFRPIGKLRASICKMYPEEPDGKGVYSAECQDCGGKYIGETSLLLSSRLKRHLSDKSSALYRHMNTDQTDGGTTSQTSLRRDSQDSKNCERKKGFEISLLRRSENIHQRKIFESFYIRDIPNNLNSTDGTEFYVFA